MGQVRGDSLFMPFGQKGTWQWVGHVLYYRPSKTWLTLYANQPKGSQKAALLPIDLCKGFNMLLHGLLKSFTSTQCNNLQYNAYNLRNVKLHQMYTRLGFFKFITWMIEPEKKSLNFFKLWLVNTHPTVNWFLKEGNYKTSMFISIKAKLWSTTSWWMSFRRRTFELIDMCATGHTSVLLSHSEVADSWFCCLRAAVAWACTGLDITNNWCWKVCQGLMMIVGGDLGP